jgi:hypothetical protein
MDPWSTPARFGNGARGDGQPRNIDASQAETRRPGLRICAYIK